jgi:cell division protein FtsN
MVDPAGNVKVMDFGIARLFQGTGQLTGTMIGTPAYMAPEQLELKRVDARTDIYAVGLLLYEMVTGSQPFVGDTPIGVALKHIREIPQRPREIVPTLPAHAEAVILKCLQKDAAKRFQSVNELMIALNRGAGPRPAASQWNRFVADFRGFGIDIKEGVQHGYIGAKEFVGQQDWRALVRQPATKKTAAGLGAACVLAVVIGISVHGSRKSQVAGPASNPPAIAEVNAKPISQPTGSFTPAKADAPKTITSFNVDLAKSSGHAAEKNQSNPHVEANAAPTAKATAKIAASETKVTRAQRNAKSQNVALVSASAKSVTPAPTAPAATDAAASTEANSKTDDSATAPSEGPTVFANPYAGSATTTGAASSANQGLFLEVGSFKDQTWADQAVEKLTQLGFQSSSVHKAKLWMQSYQVRVGPFADQAALEEARKNLVLQGFKPHPVK